MRIELQIDDKEKIFTVAFIKSRMLRKAMGFNKTMDFGNLGEEDMDELVGFVCEIFNNQFTIDEMYDGLPIERLMPTITEAMNRVSGQASSAGDDKKK